MGLVTLHRASERLGRVGSPPIAALAAARWDAIVVGAGHNGLACAAYLARAGKRVLVLEARERVGGACTLEEPWPGYRISPCAYLAGLIHPLVLDELGVRARGFRWMPADAGMFVPFDDGSSVQLWDDPARCREEIRRFAPADVAGWERMSGTMRRLRDAVRPAGAGDLWVGRAPTREQIEERLGRDEEARKLLFEWSMAELVETYLRDERLRIALLGQGVIGTNASPFDPGTASVRFHHASGRMEGRAACWGFVRGGIGTFSFILCDVASDAGAVVATGTPVARIVPERGVALACGTRIDAPVVVSNADPRTTLALLGDAADAAWRARVEAIPMVGCTVKLSVALRELPDFRARPGTLRDHHSGQVNTPLDLEEWRTSCGVARAGRLPARLWTELYFQSACDPSVAPPGRHVMSVFAQYVPHSFAQGDWDVRREEVGALAIASIARYCTNLPDAVVAMEVMGPPDIERKVGLHGGHIFHGECLPEFMWSRRLAPRTPMPGVFLCGAGTHPGGSVIGVNGRNAAHEVLAGQPSRVGSDPT
jgi:phytoene dehydrogenase-like protein